MLGNLNCRAAKLAVALRVVRIICGAFSVDSVAVKIFRVIHEVIAHAMEQPAIGNRRKTQPRPEWNSHARLHDGGSFRSPVARQHHRDLVSLRHQGLRQRFDHVRQAACFRKRQSFRCYEQYSQGILSAAFFLASQSAYATGRFPTRQAK